ncbi:MAG: urea transporter [Nitrospinae bacterium]|nr:urea transporter [Nitrospinota bacterium]
MAAIKDILKRGKTGFFVEAALHSYSQIFFSDSRSFGLIVLLSSFINPYAGLNGFLGCLSVNLFAYYIGYNRAELLSGLYGLNGVLLGMSVSYYSGSKDIHLVYLIVLFSVLLVFVIAAISGFLKAYSLPSMSIPFVLLSWLLIISGNGTSHGATLPVDSLQIENSSLHVFSRDLHRIFLKNIGLVIFNPDELAGLMILIALLFYSRIMVFITVISFLSCFTFSMTFPQYTAFILNNGFNVILTSLALGTVFFVPNWWSLSVAIISALFSVVIGNVFQNVLSLPVLAAPFNIVTLFMLISLQQNIVANGLHRVTLFSSPEKNFGHFLREKDRYGKVDYGFILPFMGWWFVSQGIDGRHTHKGIYKWGLDFVVKDRNGSIYKGNGEELEDHYCYKMPVTSVGDGVVVAAESSIHDNPVTATNLEFSWGNHIIIKHNPSIFSVIGHLRQQGIEVSPNTAVKKGQIAGFAGSSGCAPYPHLHIQFQSFGILESHSIPVCFSDFLIKQENCEYYIPLGIPEEGQTVMNIPSDAAVKDTVGFELGDKQAYQLTVNGKSHLETWSYDMDSKGILFIESGLYNDRLYFSRSDRSVSFYGYAGGRQSGLYMLSIGLEKIPFYVNERLMWHTTIPYFDMVSGIKSLLMESVQPYIGYKNLIGEHGFKRVNGKLILQSRILKNKDCIAYRSILFDRGVSEISFEGRGISLKLKRYRKSGSMPKIDTQPI